MNRSQIRAAYDKRAASYDRSVGAMERIALGSFRARFGAEMTGRTLEIAVGSGLNLPYYAPAVTGAFGVDLSIGMLREAAERALGLTLAIEFAQMDAQDLAFPDAAFDTVAISLALCTVPDPAAALREMARVCKPDGKIVLLEHVRSPHRPLALIERLISPLQERFIGCHLDRDTIGLAKSLGFDVVTEICRIGGIIRLAAARPPAL